jgi:hypothetical protein
MTATDTSYTLDRVLVEDPSSVHHGKVGSFVSHTLSGNFTLVHFDGEPTSKPVPVSVCSHYNYQTGEATPSLNDTLASSLAATRPRSGSIPALAAGAPIIVADATSLRCGQKGVVTSITPSGEYLAARMDDGTIRSFSRGMVLVRASSRTAQLEARQWAGRSSSRSTGDDISNNRSKSFATFSRYYGAE